MRKTARSSLLAASLISLGISGTFPWAYADEPVSVIPVVDIVATGNGIRIVAGAVALSNARFTGDMTIKRSGIAGNATTRHTRDFDLSSGARGDIASIDMSFNAGDRLEVTVILRDRDAILAETILSVPEQPNKKSK